MPISHRVVDAREELLALFRERKHTAVLLEKRDHVGVIARNQRRRKLFDQREKLGWSRPGAERIHQGLLRRSQLGYKNDLS